ncbi:MAG: glutathione S-transferase family protein [Myxococcota bacterium]
MTPRFDLYFHPLASYCHKVLVALYQAEIPFRPIEVDLGDPVQRAALAALWPIGKFPVLVDRLRGVTVPESTTILEHLALHGGAPALVPSDPDRALEVRAQDRFFDLYVHEPMQRIIADLLRPEGSRDPIGVAQARALTDAAYDLAEARMDGRTFAVGDGFTMADCAAAPALFYANLSHPLGPTRPNLTAYLARLMARPSFARVLREARPWFPYYPLRDRIPVAYPELGA